MLTGVEVGDGIVLAGLETGVGAVVAVVVTVCAVAGLIGSR